MLWTVGLRSSIAVSQWAPVAGSGAGRDCRICLRSTPCAVKVTALQRLPCQGHAIASEQRHGQAGLLFCSKNIKTERAMINPLLSTALLPATLLHFPLFPAAQQPAVNYSGFVIAGRFELRRADAGFHLFWQVPQGKARMARTLCRKHGALVKILSPQVKYRFRIFRSQTGPVRIEE